MMMSEIATSSEQQNSAIGHITTGVDQMNQVTQQNAANSEESASASEELSAQAAELQSLVGAFALSETHRMAGNGTAMAPSAPPRPAPTPKGTGARADNVIPLDDEDIESLSQF